MYTFSVESMLRARPRDLEEVSERKRERQVPILCQSDLDPKDGRRIRNG